MRTINFKNEELPILKEIILLGDSQYTNDFLEISKLILSKIRIEIFHFSTKEIQVLKSYCSNWINNNEELVDYLSEKYLNNMDTEFANISDVEKENMRKISIVFSIKSRLFLKNYISFIKVLEKI